jgi:hypothetical protein
MPVTWDDVKSDLNQLKQLDLRPPFDDVVAALERVVDASPKPKGYTPQKAKALIDAIPNMETLVQGGQSPDAILEQVKSGGGLDQFGWSVDTVTNVNHPINIYFLDEANKKVRARAPNPRLEVPVVLLVMNKEQAEELNDETAFADLPADFKETFKKDFAALRPLLDADWVERYGKQPEDWRPFTDTKESIKQRLATMLNLIRQRKKYESLLVPKFVDIHTLNQGWDELVSLRQKGCIVIEDAISMRYPSIQREYRRSLLDAFNKTIIIRIVPQAAALNWIEQPMLTWVEKFRDLEFYKRRVGGDDTCREIFQSMDFLGWFNTHVPSLIPKEEKVKNSVAGEIIGGGDQ